MILFLLLVTATFRPAAPAVGDLITVDFEQAVVLDASEAYEVVSHDGKRVVIRTFRPEPFELSGRVGNVLFRKLTVPVIPVLAPDDKGQPAPLKPPRPPAESRRPFNAIAIAAAIAALAWMAVLLRVRRVARASMPLPEIPAAERFRLAVERLRIDLAHGHRWAALADVTRSYLCAVEPSVGFELTTAEFLRAIATTSVPAPEVVAAILGQGDLEKFSPWGALPADFDAAAARALDLIPAPVLEEAA